MKTRVVVVGGGASGLAAAIAAARSHAEVTLIERGHALGRKVLASGGGRCNLTNARILSERFHCGRPAFVREALSRFKAREAVGFFSELGLLTLEEPDGRVFPRCGKAQAVLDVLKAELERLAVNIRLGAQTLEVRRRKEGFLVRTAAAPAPWNKAGAIAAPRPAEEIACDRVILACGGASHPQLGAGEQAYDLAKSLGHTATKLSPALVPLCVKESSLKRLRGLRVEAGVTVWKARREASRSQGEVLFTDYGISGPAALDVSREAALHAGQEPVQGSLNLFPEFTPQGLRAMVSSRWVGRPKRLLQDFFLGMFPAQLAGALMDALGWDARRPLDSLGRDAPESLAALLQDWRFEITGPRPWSEAMVTAGGVRVDEVDPRTFQSRRVPGLHLAGEMLDVDGDSGGYNLHFAWASGLCAGRSV